MAGCSSASEAVAAGGPGATIDSIAGRGLSSPRKSTGSDPEASPRNPRSSRIQSSSHSNKTLSHGLRAAASGWNREAVESGQPIGRHACPPASRSEARARSNRGRSEARQRDLRESRERTERAERAERAERTKRAERQLRRRLRDQRRVASIATISPCGARSPRSTTPQAPPRSPGVGRNEEAGSAASPRRAGAADRSCDEQRGTKPDPSWSGTPLAMTRERDPERESTRSAPDGRTPTTARWIGSADRAGPGQCRARRRPKPGWPA